MREIKFRAWDGESIISPNDFWLSADGHSAVFGRSGTIEYSNWELMQFTGLLDKNGKEIYEGDIVKGTGEHIGQSNVFYGYGVWQPFSYLGTYCGNDFEVIGNIYENPELLE